MRPERYATVRLSFLNGGAGEAVRNVTRDEFEALYKQFSFGEIPRNGIGSTGHLALYGFSWKIYDDREDYKPSILSRLLSFKIRKQMEFSR